MNKEHKEAIKRRKYLKSLSVESLPNEIWKDIYGYEERYMVSDIGRIKTKFRTVPHGDRTKTFPEVLRNQFKDDKGYFYIALHFNNLIKSFSVHRLVAQAFILNPENKPQVNHKNGNPSDNRIDNLEWNTRSENSLHAYRELGRQNPNKNATRGKNPNSKPVISIDKNGKRVVHDSLKSCAEYFNVHWTTIYCALRKRSRASKKLSGVKIRFKNKKDYKTTNLSKK